MKKSRKMKCTEISGPMLITTQNSKVKKVLAWILIPLLTAGIGALLMHLTQFYSSTVSKDYVDAELERVDSYLNRLCDVLERDTVYIESTYKNILHQYDLIQEVQENLEGIYKEAINEARDVSNHAHEVAGTYTPGRYDDALSAFRPDKP